MNLDPNMNARKASCPRCGLGNLVLARFCAGCGLSLAGAAQGVARAGRIAHPSPAKAPAAMRACDDAADLHWSWESAWGGTMILGTEGIGITVFNGGYDLARASFEVTGLDERGEDVFRVELEVTGLSQGTKKTADIPSYELTRPATDLKLRLLAADFEPID
jgi:hypothetical protein